MKIRLDILWVAICVASTMLASGAMQPAHAAEITQTIETIGPTCEDCGFGGDFGQFNSALGLLTSIGIAFNGVETFYTTAEIDPAACLSVSSDGGVCSAQYFYSVAFLFNAPGFPLVDGTGCCGPGDTPFQIANEGGDFTSSDLDPQTILQGIGPANFIVPISAFSSYEGSGTVAILGTESEDSDICNDNGVSCTLSHNLDMTTTLTYDYTPVPEPSSLPLMLAGLGLIGGAMYFGCRKSKATA